MDGDTMWTKIIGGEEDDIGYYVQQTSDGGYIITGTTRSFGAGLEDVYLIKTDEQGNVTWTQTFGGDNYDYGYCVQQTNDGGYIIVGYTYSFGVVHTDVYLIKTDENGNELWSQTFGGDEWEKGYSVRQTSDGGFIITGLFHPYGTSDVYLIKTDSNGNMQWSQTIGGNSDEAGESVQQTSDGGFIITGSTWSFGAGNIDIYLIKTNENGIVEWYQCFGGNLYDWGHTVQQTSDEGYFIAGRTTSYGDECGDIYLIKTDINGEEIWSQTYGGESYEFCGGGQLTADNGYIIVGSTQSYGAGGNDVYLIRLAPDIPPDILITLTPQNPPIQIPAGGGTFEFNIEVANTGVSAITFDVWTMATLPNGNEYGPIIYVQDIILNAGQSVNRDRMQFVPMNAPSGDYTYDGYIGDYPNVIWDEEHFEFEKLEGE